ncbi:MAG: F0F1 ATP synthase subunit delta [Sulfuriferula sp.]
MAEIATIARPYAEAVFRLAKQTGMLDAWSEQLSLAQMVATDSEMRRLAVDPEISSAQLSTLFLSVCGSRLGVEPGNLITLLIENGRINVLTEIVDQFEVLKAKQGGVLEAKVVSAFAMNGEQIAALATRLEAKFHSKLALTIEIDPALIGGIIVSVGDEVYDASVQGKLQNMAYALKR